MNYIDKTKDELIQELLLLKAENERLISSINSNTDQSNENRASELRYECFFEDNHSVMLLIDPETGEVKDVNQAASEFYGWSRTAMRKMNIANINTLSPVEVKAEMKKAITDKRRHFFFKHRLANSEIRDVEVFSGPIKFSDYTFLYSIVRDISERKQAEEAIRLSEEKYRLLFANNPQPMLIYDLDTLAILEVNDSSINQYGYTRNEFLNMTIKDIRPTGDISDLLNDIKCIPNNTSNKKVWRHYWKNGELRYVETNAQSIDFYGRKARHVLINDITEQYMITKMLEKSEERFRSIVEQSEEVVWEVDSDGLYTYVSPIAEQVYGYTIEQLVGRIHFYDLHPEDRREEIKEVTFEIFKRKESFKNFINEINKPGGECAVLLTNGIPVLNENGVLAGYRGVDIDITKRIESEKEMVKFRTIADQANYGAAITSLEGDFLYINNTLSSMMGWEANELLGKNISNLHNDEQSKQVTEIFNILWSEGGFTYKEVDYTRKDGSVFPTLMSANVILNQNAKPEFVSCTLIDITDRKISEERIKAKSSILTNLIINLKEGILLENATRKIELTNQLFCDMFGIPATPEILLGADCSESAEQSKMLFKNPDKFVEDIQHILSKREPVFNDKLELVDGRYFERDYIPTYIEDTYSGHLWKYRDITERKLAEIELNKISQAVEQSPVMTFITNLAGEIEYVNPAFTKITGYSREDLYGQNPRILSSGKKSREEYQLLWKTISSGISWQGEFKNKKKDGEFYWTSSIISPILNSNGKISHYVSVEEDITHRKQIEKELLELNSNLELKINERTLLLNEANHKLEDEIIERKQTELRILKAKDEAEKANMAKSDFLSHMSHELRTPLNSILGFAQLLEMGDLNNRQSRAVNHIMKSGKYLLDLINQVLDLARIEAGRLHISIEAVQIFELIEEMIEIIKPLADKHQISVKFDHTDIKEIYANVDRQSFKQVLLNLLNNAIKYNKPGGSVEIITETRNDIHTNSQFIKILFADTGVGINQDDISKLFIPFERISAFNTQIEGTGLGLSVVKKLVEIMGGSCGVQSKVGVGSTFWIEFPQTKSSQESLNKIEMMKGFNIDLNEKFGTILYIEDNPSNIELIQQILATIYPQIKLIINTTGKETVSLAVKYNPDIILLDLNLPDIDGSDVLKQILENDYLKDIPVIIISADAMQHQIEKLTNAGAKEFLSKPFEIADFLRIVDEYI